jgi:predicted ester cyclase
MSTMVTDKGAVLRSLLEALVVGDAEAVARCVTEEVMGWSPNLLVTSRAQLVEAALDREDSMSNVEYSIAPIHVIGDTAIAEWRVSADHTGALLLDDDLVIAPTGRRIHLAGATFAEFDGDYIRSFRIYFDDSALTEQLLPE